MAATRLRSNLAFDDQQIDGLRGPYEVGNGDIYVQASGTWDHAYVVVEARLPAPLAAQEGKELAWVEVLRMSNNSYFHIDLPRNGEFRFRQIHSGIGTSLSVAYSSELVSQG